MRGPFKPIGACALAAAIAATVGCSRATVEEAPPEPAASAETKEKSTAATVIDGVTGRTALEAHKKARSTIEKINAEREADIQEFVEDNP